MPRPLLYRLRPGVLTTRRRFAAALHFIAALLALAAPALAQSGSDSTTTPTTTTGTGPITVRAISVGDEEVKLDGEVYVGIDDCNADAELKFELDGVPNSKQSVDVYTGTSCNDKSRDTDAETTASNCEFIENFEAGSNKGLMISLHAKDLVGEDCSKDSDDVKVLWFVAVNSSQAGEEGSQYGTVPRLHLDLRRPNAPEDVTGGSGETEIPVEWKTTGSDLDSFVVLIDSRPTAGSSSGASGSGAMGDDEDGGAPQSKGGNASNGECGSSELTPGAVAGNVSSRIVRKRIAEATATGTKLKPGDIDGDSAAIAVVAVDLAGNESLISEIACVKVVPTEGFWDRYSSDPDAVDPGCPCSALGPAQLESAWPIALSLALCALSARRRRRS